MSPHEIALLQRWNESKDADAFSEIVNRYSGLVYGACLRILRNETDAEDVTQECFMKVAEAPTNVTSSLGGWLHTVATHSAISRLRSERRRQARERAFQTARPEVTNAVWDDVQHLIDDAIAGLPEDLRVPLVEHYLLRHTYESIGEELGITRQAVAGRVQKGIARIRMELRQKGIPVAPAVLSAELAQVAQTTPSAVLQKSLLNAAIGGIDAGVLATAGVAAKATSTISGYLALAAMTVLVLGAALFLLIGDPTPGDGPASEPPAAIVVPPDSQARESDTTNESRPTTLTQARTPSPVATTVAASTSTAAIIEQTPDFTEFSQLRPFPEPGVGSILIYFADPRAVGGEAAVFSIHWKPWEKVPQARLTFSETVPESRVVFFKNLPLGTYHIRVRTEASGANWYATLSEEMSGYHTIFPLLPTEDLNFEVRNKDGELIPDAEGFTYESGILGGITPFNMVPVGRRAIRGDGRPVIPGLLAGPIKAYVRAPGYAPRITGWIRSRAEPVSVVLEKGGAIECRVVEETSGEPVEGVIVHVQGPFYRDHAYEWTDADGVALLSNLRAADYSVRVYSERLVLSTDPPVVPVENGKTMALGDIRVVAGPEIIGRVYDEDTGEGIPGIRLSVEADIGVVVDDVITDAEGYYAIPNASFTRYVFTRHSTKAYGYAAGERRKAVAVSPSGLEGDTDFHLSKGLPIAGRVLDTDGRPVPGAMIRAANQLGSLRTEGLTDRQGQFTLCGIEEPGDVYIRVQAAGYGTAVLGPYDVPPEGRQDLDVTVRHAGLVTGSIRIDGRYAPASTYLYSQPHDPESEEGRTAPQSNYTYTGPIRGLYILPWLAPGTYDLLVRPPNSTMGPVAATVTVREGELVEGFDIDHYTTGVALTGTVIDRRNRPVEFAELLISSDSGTSRATRTNAQGEFSYAGLTRGRYSIEARHAKHSTTTLADVSVPSRGVRVVMRDLASVTGRVRSAVDGSSIQRFQIGRLDGILETPPVSVPELRTFSSETGEFHFDDVEIGETTFVVFAENRAPALAHVLNLRENQTAGPLDVRLQPAAVLVGTVSDSTGAPVAGARIHRRASAYGYVSDALSLGQTDAEGRFRIDRLQQGDNSLMVTHPEFAPQELSAQLAYRETTEAHITLYGGAELTGTIYIGGKPASQTAVLLRRKESGIVTNAVLTDEFGEYAIEHIPAGDYEVQVRLPDVDGQTVRTEAYAVAFGSAGALVLDMDF